VAKQEEEIQWRDWHCFIPLKYSTSHLDMNNEGTNILHNYNTIRFGKIAKDFVMNDL